MSKSRLRRISKDIKKIKVFVLGVDVKMLTGDNAATAASIAKSCNILEKDIDQSDRSILEGPEFRSRVLKEDGNLDNEEFLRIWESFKVMARCTPEDKYLLVQGIQSIKNQGRREIIAMTGIAFIDSIFYIICLFIDIVTCVLSNILNVLLMFLRVFLLVLLNVLMLI